MSVSPQIIILSHLDESRYRCPMQPTCGGKFAIRNTVGFPIEKLPANTDINLPTYVSSTVLYCTKFLTPFLSHTFPEVLGTVKMGPLSPCLAQ